MENKIFDLTKWSMDCKEQIDKTLPTAETVLASVETLLDGTISAVHYPESNRFVCWTGGSIPYLADSEKQAIFMAKELAENFNAGNYAIEDTDFYKSRCQYSC